MDRQAIINALPHRDKVVLVSRRQTIKDIMTEVLAAHEHYAADYDKITLFFENRDLVKTFRELWNFCKNKIPYREETEARQTTKSPAWIVREAVGDCKHYASFIGGVLAALQRKNRMLKIWYAFASYDKAEKLPGHVFIIAEYNGRKYWIDPVLSSFDNRLKPDHIYLVQPKNNDMALYRMGQVVDSGSEMQQSNYPIVETDLGLSRELAEAIVLLLQYGIADAKGNLSESKLKSIVNRVQKDVADKLVTAYALLHQAAVGGLFDTIARGIKKVALFAPRNAFLGLVGINAFGYATKLKNSFWDKNGNKTTAHDKVLDVWYKLGGDRSALSNTIQKGATKKAVLGATPAAVPAWVATAAAVVAAIMPLVNSFLNKAKADQLANINWNDPENFTPAPGGNTGFMGWVQQNPLIVAGVVGVGVYFLTKKRR